jgi:hypothetical protein
MLLKSANSRTFYSFTDTKAVKIYLKNQEKINMKL